MHRTYTYIRHIESRLERRLSSIGAERIGLLGAGSFTRDLLTHIGSDHRFAGAQVVAIIDESLQNQSMRMSGIPLVGSVSEARCDAVAVATSMHEPEILRRSDRSEFGDTPIVGLHQVDDPEELAVGTLLLPETAWFGLDLPGVLAEAGRSFVVASASGLPGFGLVDTASFWAEHAGAPADQLVWDSLDLFDVVKGSAACLLGRVLIDPGSDRETLVRLMDEAIRVYESALLGFTSEHAPGNVVVANGLFHHQRAVAEAAQRAGKPVFAIESSCFPAMCRLERLIGGVPANPRRSTGALKPSQWALVTSYLKERKPQSEPRIDTASQPAPEPIDSIRSQLRIPDDDKVLLLLGQVCTDTSLVYRAPLVNDVVRLAVIASGVVGRVSGWTLLIKPHPKEAAGVDPIAGKPYEQGAFDRLQDGPLVQRPHVRLVAPCRFNVYSLMRLADAGLTINSQSAMEMAAMHAKPVCVVGQASYTDAGFTRDVARVAGIEPAIYQMLNDPVLTPEEHGSALRYVYEEVYENLISTEGCNNQTCNSAMQRLLADAAPDRLYGAQSTGLHAL